MFIRELQRSWGFVSASAPTRGISPTREQRKQFQTQLPESFRDIAAYADALQGWTLFFEEWGPLTIRRET